MGLGYTLFGKPLVVLASALVTLSGLYLLPEYWPDHAAATEAIRRNDTATLGRYLARGLSPDDRTQWRSYVRRTMGRTTSVGVGPGGWTLLGRAASCGDAPLTAAMLARGADPNVDEPDGGTVLWEPTNLGWRPRPFPDAAVAAMQARGGTRPSRAPVRR